MNGIDLSNASDVYISNKLADKVYLGSKKIWDAKTSPVYTAPTAKTGLVYNGSAQSLLNDGSTNHGTIYYSSNGTDWSTVIPSSTNASNSITVYWKLVGDNRHYDIASTAITCSIAKVTPTVTAPTPKTLSYTGNAQTLANAGSTNWGTLQYSSDGSTWSTSIPTATNAGTSYKVYYRVQGNSNINDVTSAYITCSISKVAPTYTAPTAKSLTYNNTDLALLNAGSTSHGTIYYSSDGTNWSTSIPTGKNATDYNTYWKLTGDTNHTDISSTKIVVSISRVTPSVTAPTPKTLTYTGGAQNLVNAGGTDWGTLQYSLDNSTWGTAIPTGTNATSYTVYYRVVGNSNINDIPTTSVTCSIGKANPTYTAPTKTTPTYNGSNQNLLNAGVTSHGTFKYSSDGTNWGTSIPQGKNATSYDVYWKLDGDSNHNSVGSTKITTSISKVTPTVTAPTAKVLTFNGSAQALVNAGSTNFGTLQYSLNNSTWSTSIPTGTNYGSYTVYYRVVGDSNINDVSSQSVACSISEKKVTATVILSQNSFVYTGNPCIPTVTVKDGNMVIPASEYTVVYSNNVNVGTAAAVTITDNEGGNYDVTGNTTFTITKAAPTYTAPTAKSLTFTGSAQALLNAGSTSHGTIYYSADGSTWSTSIPTSINAATKITVYWKLTGDSNHSDIGSTAIDCSIAKANLNASVSLSNWTYGQTANNPSVSGNSGSGSVTYSYKVSTAADSTYSSTKPSNAGTYTVRAVIAETSNYNGATVTNTFTIAKADISPSVSMSGWTYGGTASNPSVSGNTGNGSVTYTYKVSTAAESAYSSTKPSNAGTYTVKAVIAATSNYNGATVTNTFTIAKANPSYTVPSANTLTYSGGNQNLVTAGSNITAGSFTYSKDGTSTGSSVPTGSTAGTYSVGWTFTPSDTNNYNIKSGTVSVTISKATGSTGCSARSLTYSRGVQNLVAVSGNTGTNHYRLGTSGTWSTSVPTATNASSSTYDVYVYTDASTNYNAVGSSSNPIKYSTTIGKATPVLSTTPSLATGLSYTGSAQNLLTGGAMKHSGSDTTAVAGSFAYSQGINATTYSNPSWTFTPTDTTNYNSTNGTVTGNVTIATVNATYTAPVAANPTYSGSAQNLVTAGSSSHGTFTYSTSQNGTYSSTIPQGTNVGSYTVWWKFTADSNHNSVGATQVSGVSITAKSLTITASAQTIQWGNSITTGTGQVSVSGLVSGDSLTGITLSPSTSDLTTNGTITPSSATTTKGASNYSITYNTGKLTINARSITITAKAQTITYGGSIATGTSQVTVGGSGLVSGNTLYSVSLSASRSTAGTGTITPSSAIIKNGSTDMTSKYSISYSTGVLTINTANPTISAPTAKSLTYTGGAQALVNAGTNTTAGSFTYCDTQNGTYSSTIPTKTDASTNYTVWWKFTPNDTSNYNTLTGSVACSIGKATPVMQAANSLVYNRSQQILVGYWGSTIYYRVGTSGSFSTSVPSATNGGTYTVYWYSVETTNFVAVGSSSSPQSVTVNINKATPVLSTAPTYRSGLTYTGSAQNLLQGGAMKHSSSDSTAVAGTFTYDTGTNAGTYSSKKWYFTPSQSANYNSTSGTISGSTSIAQASVHTAPVANNTTYSGSAINLLKNGSANNKGTLEYSTNGSSGWTTTVPTRTTAGSYDTWWRFTPTDTTNHVTVGATKITTTISKAAASISYGTTSVSKTYGNAAFTNTLTKSGDGSVTYSSSDTSVATVNSSGQVSIVKAGSCTITATVADGTNYTYATKTASYSLSIAKANLSASVSMSGWTYGGTATNPSVSGNSGSGSVTYTYKVSAAADSTYSSTKPSTAGTYTVRAVIAETTNYNGATVTTNFTISKANLSASVSMYGWTYGGTASSPSVSGNSGSGAVTYTYKVNGAADSTYTSTKPSNAGTYVVRAVIAETTNYNGTTVTNTFTIAKANISPSVSLTGWYYGETGNNPSVSGNSGGGTVTYTYKVNGAADSTYTSTKPSAPGTYVVRAQIAATTNYNAGTATNTFTITAQWRDNITWQNGLTWPS